MNIALTNVIINLHQSEETYSFSAVLKIDNAPLALVTNNGQGGANNYKPVYTTQDFKDLRNKIREIEEKLSKEPYVYLREYGTSVPLSLDLIVDDLLANEKETFTI